MPEPYRSFREFYPFYLSEHRDRTCRRLHVVGSALVLACVVLALLLQNAWWLGGAIIAGSGFAWVGHLYFEHNRPATFSHPIYSLIGDWAMFRDVLTGKIPF
jgi:hypothetical protein